MQRLDPALDYLFCPRTELRTVQGSHIKAAIRMCDGLSIQYEWGDAWLADWDGQIVRIYFDPYSPDPSATVVCARDCDQAKAGQLLGRVPQLCQVARYARNVLGYGDDPDEGIHIAKRTAQALRRDLHSILPDGRPLPTHTDLRTSAPVPSTPNPEPSTSSERRSSRFTRLAQLSRPISPTSPIPA
jgi:hypothetical protein